MSAHQVELRANRYYRLLQWFADQHDLAPINAIHHSILWQIHQFLVDHEDIWGRQTSRIYASWQTLSWVCMTDPLTSST
jgi:hypothetical protein